MIARRREKHLRLVFQAAEGLRMDDAIAIALKRRTHVVLSLSAQASARIGALGRLRRQVFTFSLFQLLAKGRHTIADKKLVPFASWPTPKTSARVWPRSANVCLVPRSTARTHLPVTSSGTYSRA